jgi:hypothetical protein
MKRLRIVIPLAALVVVVASALAAGLRTEEYYRASSPDGRHYAVATYRLYQACIPRMPGGGGDKPGYVTVFTRGGLSCGRAPVPMVNVVYSLRWDAKTASLPGSASWDLVDCRVERW